MTSIASSLPVATADRPVWLRVGRLHDGSASAPISDGHVVYDNTAIRFVGRDLRSLHIPPSSAFPPANDASLDALRNLAAPREGLEE